MLVDNESAGRFGSTTMRSLSSRAPHRFDCVGTSWHRRQRFAPECSNAAGNTAEHSTPRNSDHRLRDNASNDARADAEDTHAGGSRLIYDSADGDSQDHPGQPVATSRLLPPPSTKRSRGFRELHNLANLAFSPQFRKVARRPPTCKVQWRPAGRFPESSWAKLLIVSRASHVCRATDIETQLRFDLRLRNNL